MDGFSPKLGLCIDIMEIWFLGLLMCKFRPFLTELSARDTSGFSFPDDNLRKYCYVHCYCRDLLCEC